MNSGILELNWQLTRTHQVFEMLSLSILKFPATLKRVRATLGLSQKALALSLEIDQGQLCSIEKGRRQPFSEELMARFAKVIELPPKAFDELRWASAHDRCIRQLLDVQLPGEDLRLVSSVLGASRLLDPGQRNGLMDYLTELEASAIRMKTLSSRSGLHCNEGVAMN